MKVLLHICCAPCTIHPFQELSRGGENSVTGFFYNPNIHPFTEMDRRQKALADYALKEKIDVIFGKYDIENFFKSIGSDIEAPLRCEICWKMRLRGCARHAKRSGFNAFTTTLLVSPYQDRGRILEIGRGLAEEFGIKFIEDDWRPGFRDAQEFARENDIYRQKYCGCLFSEKERYMKPRLTQT